MQGGAIIPVGPPHQHVGESNVLDDLTLLVALDEHGNYHSANFTGNELDHLVGITAWLVVLHIYV